MEMTAVLELLEKGGLLVVFIFALWGGRDGWYLWKKQHETLVQQQKDAHQALLLEKEKMEKELQEQIDYWRVAAEYWQKATMESLRTTSRAVDLAEKQASKQ